MPNAESQRPMLAIVSPCSTCKNQRAFAEPGGRQNICPRRYWMAAAADLEKNKQDSHDLSHLILTGREGAETDSGSLVNPVYWDEGKATLIWVARLEDNDARVDYRTGTIVNPDITSGPERFDTDFIVCSTLPFVPEEAEAEMFQSGRYEEWHPVKLSPMMHQADEQTRGLLRYGGTAKRTSLLFKNPRVPVLDHNCPEGC